MQLLCRAHPAIRGDENDSVRGHNDTEDLPEERPSALFGKCTYLFFRHKEFEISLFT